MANQKYPLRLAKYLTLFGYPQHTDTTLHLDGFNPTRESS